MTTFIQFTPPITEAFTFTATLDSYAVNCRVPWSLFGNRWYLQMTDTSNQLIVHRALVGSPDPIGIQNIEWDKDDGVFVTTVQPHMFEYMATCNLTIRGMDPDVLNGKWSCFVLSPTEFNFRYMAINPVPIQAYGKVSYDINLAENYFFQSSLVFRQSTQNFEIDP